MAINWLGKAITAVKQLILLLLSGMSRQSGEIRRRDRISGYSVSRGGGGGRYIERHCFLVFIGVQCAAGHVYTYT